LFASDHPRGYATEESINKNRNIRKENKSGKEKWTDFWYQKNCNLDVFCYKLFLKEV
jgi:hypothetical protein